MDDLISRQKAIDKVEMLVKKYFDHPVILRNVRDMIEQLPSAQPERKNGHWEMVPDPYGFFDEIPVCSECGRTTEMRKTYKFCPNCGADMRGEQDDSI